ncbi:GNAT family N-acetyltransferase [Legionella genomosp. 1]|uniref:GNAT family N-acetyltransferase n=1 Tax=Legionella genomosp. 1 TaxID=1093625 RepID=UPI001056E039|nr:GNAT family N-acetyltransferase [Legionella genomosp. 1]
MLLRTYQLTEMQMDALTDLKNRCKAIDGGLPSFYPHILRQKRETANNILYYVDNRLVAFLSTYFFYEDACEVSVLVEPDSRRQGLASKLLFNILPLLQSKKMKRLIFSMGHKFNDSWLGPLGFNYQQSDYHMLRQSYEPILVNHSTLSFRKAVFDDAELLCEIDNSAFKMDVPSNVERFIQIMNDPDYSIYLAIKDEQPIGKAHIHWQNEKATFSDIAILPEFQGQGLGSTLLAYCINKALMQEIYKLTLDVETTNQNALNLYLRHDFKIASVFDYWVINIEKIQTLLERGHFSDDSC